jgi:hypothetical protein
MYEPADYGIAGAAALIITALWRRLLVLEDRNEVNIKHMTTTIEQLTAVINRLCERLDREKRHVSSDSAS